MLSSAFESEDAVQETFIRAWRAADRFEGRSSLRSWLYKIATNVCLDMRGASQRRARPMDLRSAQSADTPLPEPLAESTWIEPMPDARVVPGGGFEPWSLQVVEIAGGRIGGITFFLDTARLFPLFGLPPRLDA
jgi:RNA polymerase sigma factor (sigma-70 family)